MRNLTKLRYTVGFIAFFSLTAPAGAMPISIASSLFDWLSFSISGDVSVGNPTLEADLLLGNADTNMSVFGSGNEFFSDTLSAAQQFASAGNDGDDFFVASSLSTPNTDDNGTATVESNLVSIIPFTNNSFGEVGVSIDYELFSLASVDSDRDASLASASAELSILDQFFAEIDFIGNDVFVDTLDGRLASNEVIDYLDLFVNLSAGNYYAVLSNSAISITEVADAIAVREPSSLALVMFGLILLLISSKSSFKKSLHAYVAQFAHRLRAKKNDPNICAASKVNRTGRESKNNYQVV